MDLKTAYKNESTYKTGVMVRSILETVDLIEKTDMPKTEMLKQIKAKIKFEFYGYSNYMELFVLNLLNGGEIPSFAGRTDAGNKS